MDLSRVQDIIERTEELKNRLAEKKGAYNENKKRLKKEHGCSNLKEAKAKIKAQKKKRLKHEQELSELVAEFDNQLSQVED